MKGQVTIRVENQIFSLLSGQRFESQLNKKSTFKVMKVTNIATEK